MPIAKIVKKVAAETHNKAVYLRMINAEGELEATYSATEAGGGLKVQDKVKYKKFSDFTADADKFFNPPESGYEPVSGDN